MLPYGRNIIGFEPMMDGFYKNVFMTESGLKAGASNKCYESKNIINYVSDFMRVQGEKLRNRRELCQNQ